MHFASSALHEISCGCGLAFAVKLLVLSLRWNRGSFGVSIRCEARVGLTSYSKCVRNLRTPLSKQRRPSRNRGRTVGVGQRSRSRALGNEKPRSSAKKERIKNLWNAFEWWQRHKSLGHRSPTDRTRQRSLSARRKHGRICNPSSLNSQLSTRSSTRSTLDHSTALASNHLFYLNLSRFSLLPTEFKIFIQTCYSQGINTFFSPI